LSNFYITELQFCRYCQRGGILTRYTYHMYSESTFNLHKTLFIERNPFLAKNQKLSW